MVTHGVEERVDVDSEYSAGKWGQDDAALVRDLAGAPVLLCFARANGCHGVGQPPVKFPVRIGGLDPEVFDNFLGLIETTLNKQKFETQQLIAIFGIEMIPIGGKQGGIHDRHGLRVYPRAPMAILRPLCLN